MSQRTTSSGRTNSRSAHTWMNEVYEELRQLARAKMGRMKPGETLQPTALVHEVWLKLANQPNGSWQNCSHFFATAAEAMRQILADQARRKQAIKRGGGALKEEFDEGLFESPALDEEFLAVHETVDALVRHDVQIGEVVKLWYFIGLTQEEIANVLKISSRQVRYDWEYGRAWLKREIQKLRL